MKILAIAAHLDDIELSCGGFLSKAVSKGYEVEMFVLSNSAYKDINGKVFRSIAEAKKEGKLAARILGVKKIEILSFKTKDIPYNYASIAKIEKKLIKFKAELVLIPWVYDLHQDHRNVSLAALTASRNIPNVLMYEPCDFRRTHQQFMPQIYINISGFLDRKIRSIQAHKSQYEKYGHEWIEKIKILAKIRGYESSNKYAEAFQAIRLNWDLKNL